MDNHSDYDEIFLKYSTNWTADYLDDIDTSQYPFPNVLWHRKSTREVAVKASAMVVIGIMGIFLNSIILTILIKNRWLWTASNYLVGNLALVDLLTLILCPWFMLVRDFYQHFVLRNFGCKFEGFLQATFLLASMGAVILVSYDRLAAAALNSEARVTKAAAPKLIFATWFIAIALSLPWSVKREFMERQWLDYLEMFCAEDVKVLSIYWHFIIILLVWLPLGLMTVTYSTIIWRLEWSARKLSSNGGGQVVSKAKGRAMKITACVLLAAAFCRIPYTVLVYWRNNLTLEINAVEGAYNIMWFVANYLIYVNCAINPLIYGFTNLRFRRAMDRTDGVAWFRFSSWCCTCSTFYTKKGPPPDKNMAKIFVIETSPCPNKKITRVLKNILHINRDTIELSIPKVEEVTTKPTKITPIKVDNV
ncbi:neuropeptide FF receptor 2 [Papilio machaon]|uniref:neuropeptide FF receptor 2 n=1 Tax=Papilio machaon TaxID=76193 RepID=UPI001E662B5E|nr:neuropeptide FF receptor 2 [Papilio machaon]